MKKILIIFFLFTLIFNSHALAQNITIPMPTVSATPSTGPTPVNYELPYPGILPGSALYTVKLIRDKFTEVMPSSPLKKSNFYLLQADKRLAAFLILYKRGDKEVAFETLSKSQTYLDKSFEKMKEAKETDENVYEINSKIKTSSDKQKEEIDSLLKSSSGEDLNKLKDGLQKVQIIQNKVNSFNPQI